MSLKTEPVAQLAAVAAAIATFAPQERTDGAYALYQGARNMLVAAAVDEIRQRVPGLASIGWELEQDIDDSGHAYELVENVELHLSTGASISIGSLADLRQERDYGFLSEAKYAARLAELEEDHGDAAPEMLLAELAGMKAEDVPALLEVLGTVVAIMARIGLSICECDEELLGEQLNGMPEHLRLLREAGVIAPAINATSAPC